MARDERRERRHRLGTGERFVMNDSDIGYADDGLHLFMEAIEDVAPEVIERFRDDVFEPAYEASRHLPDLKPPSTSGMSRFFEELLPQPNPGPVAKILGIVETYTLIDEWSERHHLHLWARPHSHRAFFRLLLSVLEQWDLAKSTPPGDATPGSIPVRASILDLPSWLPAGFRNWDSEMLMLIVGEPPFAWTAPYRDSIAREALGKASWRHLLASINLGEYQRQYGVHPKMEDVTIPPPCLPIYDPRRPSNERDLPWEERVQRTIKLYKAQVEARLEKLGAEAVPTRRPDLDSVKALVLYQVNQTSFRSLSKKLGKSRRNLRRSIDSAAEWVGIQRRVWKGPSSGKDDRSAKPK